MNPIVFDEHGVATAEHFFPSQDVSSIGVRTTSADPSADDVFWRFVIRSGVIELPGSRVTGDAVAVIGRACPALDCVKVAVAMGSTEDRPFRLWDPQGAAGPDATVLRGRFVELVTRLGARSDGGAIAGSLLAAWSEPGRFYHDAKHLADCLATVDDALEAGANHDLAELALWYHDAVYDPRAKDNEEASAARLETDGAVLGLPPGLILRGAKLVRATAHGSAGPSDDPLAALVCDIDLAILGRDAKRFLEFEDSVRKEYAHVGSVAFAIGRGRFLASLVELPRIFTSPWAHERFEEAARRNIGQLLASPRYLAWRAFRWFRTFGRARAG
jgi:predicted metal-dependent HD superfamily phosphohydrolase